MLSRIRARDERQVRRFRDRVRASKDFGVNLLDKNPAVIMPLPKRDAFYRDAGIVKTTNAHRPEIALRKMREAEPLARAPERFLSIAHMKKLPVDVTWFLAELLNERRQPFVNRDRKRPLCFHAHEVDFFIRKIDIVPRQGERFALADSSEPEKREKVSAFFAIGIIALRSHVLNDRFEFLERRNVSPYLFASLRPNQSRDERVFGIAENAIGDGEIEKLSQKVTSGVISAPLPFASFGFAHKPFEKIARANFANGDAHPWNESFFEHARESAIAGLRAFRFSFARRDKVFDERFQFQVARTRVARVKIAQPIFQFSVCRNAIGDVRLSHFERLKPAPASDFFDPVIVPRARIPVKILRYSDDLRERVFHRRGYYKGLLPKSKAFIFDPRKRPFSSRERKKIGPAGFEPATS